MEGKLTNLTVQDVEYIYPRMREYDMQEITIQGWNYEMCRTLPRYEHAYCYKVKGKPIAALGLFETDNVIHLWFFATESINKYWKTATEFARCFIAWIERKYFGKHIMVQCMESHRQSMVWLARLGFKRTKHTMKKDNETLIYLEYK